MPCFNAGHLIASTIKSVCEQNYPNWELIIVDDGSTDQTADYLDSMESDRIKIIHQPNRGVSAARNVGLELANGKYITFLDADDALPQRSLEARVRLLESNPDIDVADGIVSVRTEDLKTELRRYTPYYRGPLLPRLLSLDSRVFFNVCYLFRSSALGHTRFPEHMTHAEDLAFFMMLAHERSLNYGHINEEVYTYRSSNSSAMSNMEGLERGYLDLLRLVDEEQMGSVIARQALRLRIAKILILSWRFRGQSIQGVAAALRALIA